MIFGQSSVACKSCGKAGIFICFLFDCNQKENLKILQVQNLNFFWFVFRIKSKKSTAETVTNIITNKMAASFVSLLQAVASFLEKRMKKHPSQPKSQFCLHEDVKTSLDMVRRRLLSPI